MTDPGQASFWTQANALLRKNLTSQKRNIWTNVRLVAIPVILCVLLIVIQFLFETQMNTSDYECGCTCVPIGDGKCQKKCGIEYSTPLQGGFCAIRRPPKWPPLLQIPAPPYRAIRTDFLSNMDLPSESCRRTGSCAVTTLLTGDNRTFGQIMAGSMFSGPFRHNSSDTVRSLAEAVAGTSAESVFLNFLDSAFISDPPLYSIQRKCNPNSTFSVTIEQPQLHLPKEVQCVQGLYLWRNSSSEVNNELYKGYRKGNLERQTNEFVTAYDFMDSSRNKLNAHIWYNATYKNESLYDPIAVIRVPRSVNLVSNAYLEFLRGPGTKLLFNYVKEMPKVETKLNLDIASLIGPLFYSWVILLLFPVILNSLVYEKQQKLRIMMKMHGLGDGPYWMISYGYFLLMSLVYLICFVVFGSAIGLKFFLRNDYSLQFVFYVIYLNLQIVLAFLVASTFSNIRTATVVGYIGVFGTGLLGAFLFEFFLQDESFPRGWITVMELYPGFSLYRGLYELAQFSFRAYYTGNDGMQWRDFNDSGMKEVFIIIMVEWLLVLFVAYYVDQVVSWGKSPFLFVHNSFKKPTSSLRIQSNLQRQGSKGFVQIEKPDINQEREKVVQLLHESSTSHTILCDNLSKVYPGIDGNPPKSAVRGLSIALPTGECFGMLGPNGAGKTSFINMMTGLIQPTFGTAFVQGLDIQTNMDKIYTSMGVCPQNDLLWEALTGREHLLFYGRLKNLRGLALKQSVEESLRSVNLFHGGVADKQAGKYSGGMKRRLSVAISLIGNPKVVYMDEPSTGLDPASRKNLWEVVKRAKQDSAIILTTHSMEEAEVLCDRLGIFVDGSLQCIGNPKELKARYGGSYVFTMTTSADNEQEVEVMVRHLSPNAKKIYHISGIQKFELPKQEVRISDVFLSIEKAMRIFIVFAWGLADTTLEDVFIKVARGAQAFSTLS